MQASSSSKSRKPWYQRAKDMTTFWKALNKTSTCSSSYLWKAIKFTKLPSSSSSSNPTKQKQLKKCTSLRVATSFTRVCLCAPIVSSYTEIFNVEAPPRRSYSYPRSKPFPPPPPPPPSNSQEMRVPSMRRSTDKRKIFRGKSLTDNVLMRRFVIEEEAMMQVRRRNQMEIIRRRHEMRRKKIGPSPLSRMVLAKP